MPRTKPLAQGAPLSPAEERVALLLVEGKSTKKIARELFIEVSTVKHHAEAIRVKIGYTSSVLGAAHWYYRTYRPRQREERAVARAAAVNRMFVSN